jgi:hypothetical protein
MIAAFKGSGPEMPQPAEATNGHISWHKLMASQWEPAFRFYSQLFGWQKTDAMDMGSTSKARKRSSYAAFDRSRIPSSRARPRNDCAMPACGKPGAPGGAGVRPATGA